MSKKQGMIIAFDGPDGVGKSTQLQLTADWLESQGFKVFRTRFSGASGIGEELRKASLSDHDRPALTDVYISLAMGTALAEQLKKHKAKGEICLIDRSPLAIVAYNTYGSELPNKTQGLQAAEEMFHAWQLDALVSLDADQSIIDTRRKQRTDKPLDYFEKQGTDYHLRVRDGYKVGLKMLADDPTLVKHVLKIDATPDVETVQQAIRTALQNLL